ncbi:MAG: HRDC domain-containing protein, partial [Actinomycetota bacterium]
NLRVKTVGRDHTPHLTSLRGAVDQLHGSERRPVDWRAQIERTRNRIPGSEPATTAGSPDQGGRPPDRPLLDELRRWRANRAKAAGVAPHVICDDRTLQAIATAEPASVSQLAAVPGMRPGRLSRWGEDILALVGDRGSVTTAE